MEWWVTFAVVALLRDLVHGVVGCANPAAVAVGTKGGCECPHADQPAYSTCARARERGLTVRYGSLQGRAANRSAEAQRLQVKAVQISAGCCKEQAGPGVLTSPECQPAYGVQHSHVGAGSDSTASTHPLLPHAPHPHPYTQVDVTVGGSKRRIYAYEVDGLGGVLASFDDPNIPSLLSIPVLGYSHYDAQIYKDTRATILSSANRYGAEGIE